MPFQINNNLIIKFIIIIIFILTYTANCKSKSVKLQPEIQYSDSVIKFGNRLSQMNYKDTSKSIWKCWAILCVWLTQPLSCQLSKQFAFNNIVLMSTLPWLHMYSKIGFCTRASFWQDCGMCNRVCMNVYFSMLMFTNI